jgi:hypothetical protein
VVSDHFHTRSGKIVQPAREWWNVVPSNDRYLESFTKLSEVNLSVQEATSDDDITLVSQLGEAGCVVNMEAEEEQMAF